MVRMNLLDVNTEIKSFSDVRKIEDSITHLNGRIASYCDLLTRDDAQSTTDGLPYFQISTEGAYGLSYFLEDCKTIINKLFGGYFKIKYDPKQTIKESNSEEKQEQPTAPAASPVSFTAAVAPAPSIKNDLPADVSNELFLQAGELSEAVNILTIIEDHHFTNLSSPTPCNEEIERIGNLIKLATTKIILTRDSLEKMINDPGLRQFGLAGRPAI